jgi:AGCS family alanine or glycine:cation symporter
MAAITDTTIIWNIAAVGIVVMTLPNLLGIMLLRKEVKGSIEDYWQAQLDPDSPQNLRNLQKK